MKNPQLCIVMQQDVYDWIKALSSEQHRSMSQMAAYLLEKNYKEATNYGKATNESN